MAAKGEEIPLQENPKASTSRQQETTLIMNGNGDALYLYGNALLHLYCARDNANFIQT